jgi:hypothetical protein
MTDIPDEAVDEFKAENARLREQVADLEMWGTNRSEWAVTVIDALGEDRDWTCAADLAADVARTITRLRARVEALTEALAEIVNASRDEGLAAMCNWMRGRAAAALSDGERSDPSTDEGNR